MAKLSVLYDVINMDVSALAALDVTNGQSKIDSSRERGFCVVKTEYYMCMQNGQTQDTVVVGIGGPDLSPAEIEEAIEADPQKPNDPSASEHVMRRLWPLEILGLDKHTAKGVEKLNWSYPEGSAMNWFAYNPDSAAAIGSSVTVVIFAKHYGVWLND